MIKAVFLDVDGTVFSHRTNSIPPSAVKAVSEIQKRGIMVFAATGRHPWEIGNMNMKMFEPDGWLYMNGACCKDSEGIYYAVPCEQNDLETVVSAMEELHFPCQLLTEDMIWINMVNEFVVDEQAAVHTPVPPERDPREVIKEPVYMMIPLVHEDIWETVFSKTEHLKYTRWTDLSADVFHESADKAEGIRKTLQRYHLGRHEVIAVGDGPNDLCMKEACGSFAAMGNALDEVKEKADYVTDDIDCDGLYKAFVHYGLLEDRL